MVIWIPPARWGWGFLRSCDRIWNVLGDGLVGAQPGAPRQPKDDQVDVFAARPHLDRLPGFPLAAAQVATGQDAREKSLKGHLGAFKSRWFARPPVTEFTAYMIVPFVVRDDQFIDDVRVMGNVLQPSSLAPSRCGSRAARGGRRDDRGV